MALEKFGLTLQTVFVLVLLLMSSAIAIKLSLDNCSDQFLDIVCHVMTFQYSD